MRASSGVGALGGRPEEGAPPPPGEDENLGFLAGGRREPTSPTRKRIERLRRIRRPESGFEPGWVTFGPQGPRETGWESVICGPHFRIGIFVASTQISGELHVGLPAEYNSPFQTGLAGSSRVGARGE